VVATDSIKNTIYIKAKEHPVNPPELYASHLGQHFLDRYPHISAAHINVVVHRWTRMEVDGNPHPHSFFRDGQETRNVEATVTRGQGFDLKSSIAGLSVLKSTGSAFHGFVRDEYTTLPETWDRILSTDIDCAWTWKRFSDLKGVIDGVERFDKAWESARGIILKTFATDDSASVQNTMYKMCEQILEAVPEVDKTGFSLPNKHYFEIGEFPGFYKREDFRTDYSRRRPQLAQGHQEHGQGRRGLCAPVWAKRAHQVRGYPRRFDAAFPREAAELGRRQDWGRRV
jgi:urate oxidase